PVLVDAQTLEVTDNRPLPWYMTALLLSEPLHFGDYGGMPMKILWAVLDVITIILLGSGLYLWLARGRKAPGQEDRAPEQQRAKRSAASRDYKSASITNMQQMWQTPAALAVITAVGLIAALVGDGWMDVLSWAALAVPVAVMMWKWGKQ
ncbi:MAG TPA: hypothetical protein DEB15_05845, partial [Pusillimonas sp.]|nr:hypothetical protein [Pusillimonas sp.]